MAGQRLASCEAEFSRLEGQSDPDLWAGAAAAWEANPYFCGYSRMREGEAALARRDAARAAAALAVAERIATSLRAELLRRAVETQAALISRPRSAERALPGDVIRGHFDLSPREREVLGLLVAGRSDGEIGETLFISPKTGSVHVSHIKDKLGAQNRVEIVTHAIGLGLAEALSSPTPIERPNVAAPVRPDE
jgi:DNA-binding CsgD family transcriptional regulator